MRLRSLFPLLAILALPGCLTEESPPDPDIPSTVFNPLLNVDISASTRLPSGTYYRDLTPGTGEVVATGQTINVRYVGWLVNGQKFDETIPGGPTFQFQLGAGQVIAGWDAGLPGMRVGGLRQLIIPPSQAYGRVPPSGIPPNAILVFNVNVVSIQ